MKAFKRIKQTTNKKMDELEVSTRIHNAKKRLFDIDSLLDKEDTPYEVLYDDGLAKLRHYLPIQANQENQPADAAQKKQPYPLLFVSPLAVNTSIYDLLENRSLIHYVLTQGFDVYLIDWGQPTRKQSHKGFGYYVVEALPAMIKAVRKYSGKQKLHLHGWSMGGLFSVLYTAYAKDTDIESLVLVGVPIDTDASGYIGKFSSLARKTLNATEHVTGVHPKYLPSQLMHTYSWMNMMAFKVIDPIGTSKSYWHLFKNLNNDVSLKENAAKAHFLNSMLDYPGRIIKDVAFFFWLENAFIKGTFKLNGQIIDLKNIKSKIMVVTGRSDTLITTASARAILDIVDNDKNYFMEIPGGHVGILNSRISSERVWPKMVEWLQNGQIVD